MRLPAYRASYLGRYHPYPRTRAPAREVVMVRALLSDILHYKILTSPASLVQSAAESEPAEENSTGSPADSETANTVCDDLSGLDSCLSTPR